MAKTALLIRLRDDGSSEWARVADDGRLLDGPREGLPAVADAGEDRIVALAPGEAVLLTEATVPTRNPAKLRRALPYALEDGLVGDVTEQHVAAGPPGPEGRVAAAVVARQRLDGWLARLAEAGLEPDAMVPEPLALPLDGDGATVLFEDGRAVARIGARDGFACETSLLGALETLPGTRAYRAPGADEPPAEYRPTRSLDEPVLQWLAGGAGERPLDLLQGEYRPRRRGRAARRLWVAAAALVLAWGVLELGLLAADYLRLKQANERLDARVESVFRDSFPDQPVRDPVAQMRQQLGLMTDSGRGALDMLRGVAPVLDRAVNVRLESLEYRENRLTLDVRADNIGALDALRNALAASGPYSVELASATATENGVDGRLAVSGGGA